MPRRGCAVDGPQNAAAFCNAGRCIEHNVDWIAGCIAHLRARGLMRFVPTAAEGYPGCRMD